MRGRGIPRRIRRARDRSLAAAVGARDHLRLRRRVPHIADAADAIDAYRERLRPLHDLYRTTVSSTAMAASLETASFLLLWCETAQPRTILDLGSGFSSAVFRRYAADAPHEVTVWSVDDDAGWLERTAAFLAEQGLPTDHLLVWDRLADEGPRNVDLVFHDAGSMAFRERVLADVVERLAEGGALVLDDVHFRPYGPAARRLTRGAGMDFMSLRPLTLDSFGRFAALAIGARHA